MAASILDGSRDLVFRTDRLTLRPPVYSDAPSLHAMLSDPDVCRFSPHLPVSDVAATHFMIVDWRERRAQGVQSFAVARTDRRREAIGLLQVGEDEELGGLISPFWSRQGYATEALAGAIAALRLTRAWTIIDADHAVLIHVLGKLSIKPSRRLPRHRVHPQISDRKRDCLLMRQA